MVRINQLPLGFEDLEEVVPQAPDLLLLPKTENAEQVKEADRRIGEITAREGIERPIWLMPILESAIGVENAFAIASASQRICAMTIGLEDYTSDLGVIKTADGQETLYARMRLVNAAKAAGVQAIDSVYADIGNLEGLARWGEQSRAIGFEGMGCVHPSQIAVVERAFAPAQAEVEKALKIVVAFEEAQAKGLGRGEHWLDAIPRPGRTMPARNHQQASRRNRRHFLPRRRGSDDSFHPAQTAAAEDKCFRGRIR